MLALLVAREVADVGVRNDTLEDVLDEWRSGDLDLADDVRVVEDGDGRVVGYVAVRRTGTLAVVRPEYEGRGIGTRLLEWAELRERERGRDERPVSPPSRWRSYRDVDAAEDPPSLARQLEGIAAVPFLAAEKERSLELLALGPGGAVLDVGCGAGPELARLAQIVGAKGRVVGLDRSESLLGAARERGLEALGPVAVLQGDAGALPFGDGEFDACRADRTLQHLADPEVALAEMVRVTRARGRVVVTESRWGLVAPSLDQRVTDSILGMMATGAEQAGWVGYRLPAMFEQAGLSSVRSVSGDHTVGEHDEFFRFTHLDALSGDEATAWLGDLSDLLKRGEAFAMVLVLHVAGVKPAAR